MLFDQGEVITSGNGDVKTSYPSSTIRINSLKSDSIALTLLTYVIAGKSRNDAMPVPTWPVSPSVARSPQSRAGCDRR